MKVTVKSLLYLNSDEKSIDYIKNYHFHKKKRLFQNENVKSHNSQRFTTLYSITVHT